MKAGRGATSEPTRGDDEDGGQPTDELNADRGHRLIHRVYTVFNAKQIEGIPEWTPKQRTVFEVVEVAERILNNCGATVRHDQADRAFYNRSSDSIHLPPKYAFKDAASYYGTALHEAAHSSGHPSRLNRPTLTESYRFGDVSYAKEELRAELASLFLAAERGIPHDPEQHAAYVGAWIKTLKEDKNEIFRAAHDASKAADFLLGLERERSISGEVLPAALARDSAQLGALPQVLLAGRTKNSNPRERGTGIASSAGVDGRAPNRETLFRARTTGRGR